MSLDVTYTFDEFTDDELDNIDSGGFITIPGFYLVEIDDVVDKDGKIQIVNRVLTGPFKKTKVMVFLRDPSEADDPKECMKQNGGIIKRLGLASKEQIAAAKIGGGLRVNWLSAIGRQAWIQLDARKQEKGKYAGQVMCQPTYIPYFPVNDARVPDAAKLAAGLAPTRTMFDQAAGNGAGSGSATATATDTTAPAGSTAGDAPTTTAAPAPAASKWDALV